MKNRSAITKDVQVHSKYSGQFQRLFLLYSGSHRKSSLFPTGYNSPGCWGKYYTAGVSSFGFSTFLLVCSFHKDQKGSLLSLHSFVYFSLYTGWILNQSLYGTSWRSLIYHVVLMRLLRKLLRNCLIKRYFKFSDQISCKHLAYTLHFMWPLSTRHNFISKF